MAKKMYRIVYNRLKNSDGFSILEAIISIAAIALMSGFILRMFLVSNTANKNAENIDQATLLAASEIDLYKAQKNADDYGKACKNALVAQTDDGYEVQWFYDKAWNKLTAGQLEPLAGDASLQAPAGTLYILRLSFVRDKEQSYETDSFSGVQNTKSYRGYSGEYINIEAVVRDVMKPAEAQELVKLETAKYFSY